MFTKRNQEWKKVKIEIEKGNLILKEKTKKYQQTKRSN